MRRFAVFWLVVSTLWGVAITPALAAGSWVGASTLPTLRQRGWRYVSESLEPRPTTPLNGQGITRVSWQYDYRRWDPGLKVALCGAGRCIDASSERGASRTFAALPVATVFHFYFMLDGQGMLNVPLRGNTAQLVVNFE